MFSGEHVMATPFGQPGLSPENRGLWIASPSMMQDRDRSRASASTISGKRSVKVITRAAVEPRPCAVLTGDDPEAVMVDFVQPRLAVGRLDSLDKGEYESRAAHVGSSLRALLRRSQDGGIERVSKR
jgi:hypothetical protein